MGTSDLVLNLSPPGNSSVDPVTRLRLGSLLLLAPALAPTALTLPSTRSWTPCSDALASSGLGVFSPGLCVRLRSNSLLSWFSAPFAGFTDS